mgnify:CR=1 FL=1
MLTMGIDSGSAMTKAVLFDGQEIVDFRMEPSGSTPGRVIHRLYEELRTPDTAFVVATGYGRALLPEADKSITEITCHGKGAWHLFGRNGTVIDIGGQDTKGIALKNGRVMKFIMNDKCSAGTGKFLEVMTNRLGLTMEELSDLASRGNPITISSMCTVFAESEVISLIGKGTPREDIAYGVIESVVTKVVQQVEGDQYFLTGGLCEDPYILERLSLALHAPVESVPLARYAGAIGAALTAAV